MPLWPIISAMRRAPYSAASGGTSSSRWGWADVELTMPWCLMQRKPGPDGLEIGGVERQRDVDDLLDGRHQPAHDRRPLLLLRADVEIQDAGAVLHLLLGQPLDARRVAGGYRVLDVGGDDVDVLADDQHVPPWSPPVKRPW